MYDRFLDKNGYKESTCENIKCRCSNCTCNPCICTEEDPCGCDDKRLIELRGGQ